MWLLELHVCSRGADCDRKQTMLTDAPPMYDQAVGPTNCSNDFKQQSFRVTIVLFDNSLLRYWSLLHAIAEVSSPPCLLLARLVLFVCWPQDSLHLLCKSCTHNINTWDV